jgi:hypothetical protein
VGLSKSYSGSRQIRCPFVRRDLFILAVCGYSALLYSEDRRKIVTNRTCSVCEGLQGRAVTVALRRNSLAIV